jgi:isochorismate hydrolase
MKDLFLQLEKDPEMQEILADLTEAQRDTLLIEMRYIADSFGRSLKTLKEKLSDEDSIVKFVDKLGKAISMGDMSDNIGTEVLQWPEKR